MAKAEKLRPFIIKWEGGYSNDPIDRGGATNKGITIATFRQFYGRDKTIEDLKRMSDEQWLHIFKLGYWDKFRADEILNQSIANICVDWAWHSGVITAIKKVQGILGVTADGIVGSKTLEAINKADARRLFEKIKSARISYLDAIVRNSPTQKKFINGWRNRINALNFTS